VATLKQQQRNPLDYLTAACEAILRDEAAPSLLPADVAACQRAAAYSFVPPERFVRASGIEQRELGDLREKEIPGSPNDVLGMASRAGTLFCRKSLDVRRAAIDRQNAWVSWFHGMTPASFCNPNEASFALVNL
jgi:hypothetical protein